MNMIKSQLLRPAHWHPFELIFWVAAFAAPLLFKQHALILNEIAIVALFAISLDLILGYTGVVSLGHAAFLGFGAYTAALFAKYGFSDPILGLFVSALATAVLGALCSLTIIRGSDLTRIMVTLGTALILFELANKLAWLTGGADGLQGVVIGPIFGLFEFDLYGQTAAFYSMTVLALLFFFVRRIVNSSFGASLMAVRDNSFRAAAIGIPVTALLIISYTISASIAGVAGALLAQTASFVSLDVFALERSADVLLILIIGGVGWLYGGILGAIIFKVLHSVISGITPQYWIFWAGLFLVVLVLVGRERLLFPWIWLRQRGGSYE
jgi:branched-chain amino acid transport system permease protein